MRAATVIIPARDAAATLARTLEALPGQGAAEVIVVDAGSSDDTAGIAEAAAIVDRVVRTPPAGPGEARNAGAAVAGRDALVFLDADCVPAENWLAAGLRALEDADLVQGRVEPDPEAARGPLDRTLWVTRATGLFETANLFVRADLFRRLGGFEDWLPGPAVRFGPATVPAKPLGEDVLFGWCARRTGARTAFCPEALAHHAVFERDAWDFVADRGRLRNFPHIVRRVPELRDAFLFGGLFLTRQSALFDLALTGVAAAALTRRAAPLAAALPYARDVRRFARRAPGHPPLRTAAALVAADAFGALALARGSAETRTPVL